MKIEYIPNNAIKPSSWRANYLLKPDLELLRLSMSDFGWLQPIIVRVEDMSIIDGHHRWVVAGEPAFIKKHGKQIPVMYQDIDLIDAMIMHIRLNRARGEMFAKPFSKMLKSIVLSDKYSSEELEDLLIMSPDEVDLMLAGGLLKQRKIPQHNYSRAWVPIEAPSKEQVEKALIERPPNADR
jgi:ParB-like chromosome segregation protein Spo0J